MCGIAGFVSARTSGRERQLVKEMLPHLARRGPDAEGIVTWPGVAFGHRRSAILDLSQLGNQPMVSDDGNIGLVFNGWLYLQLPGVTGKSDKMRHPLPFGM
jgi:asparagine synthase (glutamine-hydrolysing)